MCFLNQWVKKRKRSVRVSMEAEAGFQSWRGLAPGRSRPGARCPQVRPSERGPGGRGTAARLQAPGLHWPGRQTAPLTRGSGGGGRGARRELGIPSPPPPERLPQSAERPPDDAYKQGGAAAAGTSDLGCLARDPLPMLVLPQPPQLPLLHLLPLRQQAPTGAAPPATIPSRWVLATGHPLRMPTTQPMKGAGIAFLPLGRGAE